LSQNPIEIITAKKAEFEQLQKDLCNMGLLSRETDLNLRNQINCLKYCLDVLAEHPPIDPKPIGDVIDKMDAYADQVAKMSLSEDNMNDIANGIIDFSNDLKGLI
jgi:hypothetical protein